jgi:vanillate O-demethylase ferredoxin subunit
VNVTEGRLDLTVTEARSETSLIRTIRLARPHGEPLPSWEAGAHITIRTPKGDDRSYSLINFSPEASAATRPNSYRLGVRLENPSQGGSTFMHALKVGDTVSILPPQNNFPLEPTGKPVVLLAGGIGVTPIVSMAAELVTAGRPFRFIYCGRSRDQLAFLSDIEALAGERLTVHTDDTAGLFNLEALMRSLTGGEPLYLCGPTPMIERAIELAKTLGWAPDRLRFEIFTEAKPQAGDQPFEVVLSSTGESFTIPVGKSILDVLLDAGHDPLHDCKRGDCGICQVGVVEGIPDHRDFILSDAEKAGGKVIQICVSRSKTPRLVIDL